MKKEDEYLFILTCSLENYSFSFLKKILETKNVSMLLNNNKTPNIAKRNVTYGLHGSGCHTGTKPLGVR